MKSDDPETYFGFGAGQPLLVERAGGGWVRAVAIHTAPGIIRSRPFLLSWNIRATGTDICGRQRLRNALRSAASVLRQAGASESCDHACRNQEFQTGRRKSRGDHL